jgi:hypothetical protein
MMFVISRVSKNTALARVAHVDAGAVAFGAFTAVLWATRKVSSMAERILTKTLRVASGVSITAGGSLLAR